LAAGPLSDWLKAMLVYSKVLQSIAPLEKELGELTQQLNFSKKKVGETQADLAII
jgi:dynein heavy chain 2